MSRAPVKMVCTACRSDDVVRDAWSEWDVDQQQWVLRATFDQAFCEVCGGETSLVEIPADGGSGADSP